MKIVHLMYWYCKDMGYQENFLPAEQAKLGMDVYIITSNLLPFFKGINEDSRKLDPGIFKEKDVKIYRLPTIFEIKDGGQLILKGVKKKLNEIKPDIVHSHGAFTFTTIYAIHYQKKFKYKLFIDDHSHTGNFHIDKLHKRIFILLAKRYIERTRNRINCLFPVQYSSKNILKKYFPNIKKKVLHLGANDKFFYPSNELRQLFRDKLGVMENELLIITSGKLDEDKDITYLLDAFLELEYNERYFLLIIGNGTLEYMKKLKQRVKNCNIPERIIFIDFLKNQDLNKYYNAADIGIWPGNHSIGVIEAIATGLAVIVPESDIGYRILFQNKAAIGFKRRNIKSLQNSIEILSRKKERDEIRKYGLSLISNILSWTNIAKKSIEYYQYF